MKIIIKTGTMKLKGEEQADIFTITDGIYYAYEKITDKDQWDNLLSGGKYEEWFSQLCKNSKNDGVFDILINITELIVDNLTVDIDFDLCLE